MSNKKNRTTDETTPKAEIFSDEEMEILTLTDEQGTQTEFYEVAVVEYQSGFYALLQPVEAMDGVEEDEVMIFRIEREDDETDRLVIEENEEVIDAVFEEYLKAAADQETGCGCGEDGCDCGEESCDCDDEECGCGCDCHHRDDKDSH